MEKGLVQRYTMSKWQNQDHYSNILILVPENIPLPFGCPLNSLFGEEMSSSFLIIIGSRREGYQWDTSSPPPLIQNSLEVSKENGMSRSKPYLVAMDTAPVWESKQRGQVDTIPVTGVVPSSCRRHRFPGDESTCRDQRELGFMLWAGRSYVLKGPWCLQEETEMRKIRLRLANGNLGAKWQKSAVVKGSPTEATVLTAMSSPTASWTPTGTNSPSCRESEQKALAALGSTYGQGGFPRFTEGVLECQNWDIIK